MLPASRQMGIFQSMILFYTVNSRWQLQSFKPSPSDISSFSANQIVVFLEKLLSASEPLTAEQSKVLGTTYNLMESRNVELSSRYFRLGLRAKDTSVYKPTAKLLGEVGRMKFVRPLYQELVKVDRELALKTFEENKDFYHPICRGLVQKDLQKKM